MLFTTPKWLFFGPLTLLTRCVISVQVILSFAFAEALKGDRKGQHSIRINDQWRICFRWEGANAHDVEIVDYH